LSWEAIAEKALKNERITLQEGLDILAADDRELLRIMHASYQVRFHFFQKKVKLNMIFNAKSGYCSQSMISKAPVERYTMLDQKTIVAGAREALKRKAGTFCIVASGRAPSHRELDEVTAAVKEITETMPLKVCACLGLLNEEKAKRVKEAGVHRYNHNINAHHDHITTTHT